MNILITNPCYDETTSYLYPYTKKLVKHAKNIGIKPLYLERPKLKREIFGDIIQTKNPQLVLLNGHGDEKTIYGDKIDNEAEILIQEDLNPELLNNRLVYARACCAAYSLGNKCVGEYGCFIGYIFPFSFWTDPTRASTPIKDKIAKLFLEPSNLLAESLITGKSASESARVFRRTTVKNIKDLMKNRKEPGAMQFISVLWSNIQAQKIIGDTNLRFNKES